MENEKENDKIHHDCCMKKNEDNPGFQKYLLVMMVGAVLVLSIMQSFQIISLKNSKISSQISAAAVSGQIDMTGWTEDEKMMYEHHGVLPSKAQTGAKAPSSNMVGGC